MTDQPTVTHTHTWDGSTLPGWLPADDAHTVLHARDDDTQPQPGWMLVRWSDGIITVNSPQAADRTFGPDGIWGRLQRAEAELADRDAAESADAAAGSYAGSSEHAIAHPEPWLHVTFTSPDPTTANTSALAIADHLRAEFDGIHMRITTNAVEGTTDPDIPLDKNGPTIPNRQVNEGESADNPADNKRTPAALRDLIDTVLRTTPRADCADWPAREAHGQGHRYDMRCALCAGEADTLTDAIHAALQPRLAALAAYENAITWHTGCLNCARLLDSGIRETERADRAENAVAHARGLHRETCPLARGKVGRAAFTCGMCDALDGRPDTPAWTPPPPGSDRDKLPDHLLGLIADRMRPYLSTACETAAALEAATTEHPAHADELRQWTEREHASCRLTRKQDMAGCVCGCHPTEEQP